jgi:HSP20 family protein
MMDPFGDMDDMINRLPSVVNNPMRAFVPALDMYETDKAVVIETPLAGVKPENVQVSVQKGVLTLRGETKNEHEIEEKNYYRKEVRSGSFYREVPLPSPVLEDKVTAEFEDGILRVTAPKAKPTDTKKIDVKVIKKEKK